MSRLFQLCALFVAFLVTPGSGEFLESVVHVASDGHTAHAIDDSEHAPEGDEHGCTGMMHCCTCCGVPSVALSDARLAVRGSSRGVRVELPDLMGGEAPGHGARLDRPPTA